MDTTPKLVWMAPPVLGRLVVTEPAKVLANRADVGRKRQRLPQTSPGADFQELQGAPLVPLEAIPDALTSHGNADELTPLAVLADVNVRVAEGNDWPPDTRLSYRLRGNYRGPLHGTGTVQWQQRNGSYQVDVQLTLALLLNMSLTSQGAVSDAGLLPSVYQEQFPGRTRQVVLDGIAVRFFDGNAVRQPPGAQDTASQFVELTRRFATGRTPLVVGAEVPVWLVRPNALHLWTYDVVALETLALPNYGEVPAFHLYPRPVSNPRGQISAELWFAPSLQYLPVRVKISLGEGNYVDLLVEQIEQGPRE